MICKIPMTECFQHNGVVACRFSTTPEVQRRDGPGRGGVGGAGGENYEGDDETSMAEPAASCRRRSGRSSQIKQLQEENQALRRSLRELQRRSQANEHRSVT